MTANWKSYKHSDTRNVTNASFKLISKPKNRCYVHYAIWGHQIRISLCDDIYSVKNATYRRVALCSELSFV